RKAPAAPSPRPAARATTEARRRAPAAPSPRPAARATTEARRRAPAAPSPRPAPPTPVPTEGTSAAAPRRPRSGGAFVVPAHSPAVRLASQRQREADHVADQAVVVPSAETER